MSSPLNEIEPLRQAALAELKAAPDLAALEHAKGDWIGAHGKFTVLMKQLGSLPKEDRPAAGKLINQAKSELEAALASRRGELELKAALPKEPTDFTLPGRRRTLGKLHPLTQVTEDIVRSFRRIGFAVADGPEVEDEYHCFDALNTLLATLKTLFTCKARAQIACCCARTPPPCRSASCKNNRRRFASSSRAG